MQRSEALLAAMSASGLRACFDPLRFQQLQFRHPHRSRSRQRPHFDLMQVQQLLFLVGRELLDSTSGTGFGPSAYGPFNPDLAGVLGDLAEQGKISIDEAGGYVTYRVTEWGQADGHAALDRLEKRVTRQIAVAARWVLFWDYWTRVASICEAYPEMTAASKDLEAAIANAPPRRLQPLHPIYGWVVLAFAACMGQFMLWGGLSEIGLGRPLYGAFYATFGIAWPLALSVMMGHHHMAPLDWLLKRWRKDQGRRV